MRVAEAFSTWVKYTHRRSHGPALPFTDIVLLHSIRLFSTPQSLAELRRFTNAHALPRLQEGLRSLQRAGLIAAHRTRGSRETRYAITERGASVTARYAELREGALVDLCKAEVAIVQAMGTATELLERMVGLYRQAAQRLADEDFLRTRSTESTRRAVAASGTSRDRAGPRARRGARATRSTRR